MTWSYTAALWRRRVILLGIAMAPAILGGFLWFVVWKGLGGPDEQHGWWVPLWVLSYLPTCLTLVFLGGRGARLGLGSLGLPTLNVQLKLYTAFLLGLCVGAQIFYDWPFDGSIGFRRHLEAGPWTFFEREASLVLVWTLLLAFFSFGALMLCRCLASKRLQLSFVKTMAMQVATAVLPTSVLIIGFVWWFGDDPKFVPVRGILAGVVLRTSFFFGLLTGSGAVMTRFRGMTYLGSGANADVYKALDRVDRRLCAVKVFSSALSADDLASLVGELRIVSGLQHPGLVRYYSQEVEELLGRPMIRMEFVPGRTLKSIANWQGPVCERQPLWIVAPWLLGCLEPLEYLHGKGVVHRDLHAGNVMLQDDGRIRLVDFGTARAISRRETNTEFRVAGAMTHAAPEKWVEPAKAGKESDYFSLGVIAYLLTSGRLPFWQDSMIRLFEDIRCGNYMAASKVCEELPPELDQLIAGLLCSDRHSRLCDRQALEDQLSGLLEHQGVSPA